MAAALDAMARDETVPPTQTGPLGLRLRKVIAESDTHRDGLRRWAAQAMVTAVWGGPHEAVRKTATTRSRLSSDWRTELLADLGGPPVPPAPDQLFWAKLRNPDIDASYYASAYAQDQGQS
ncbi:hypothetical protein [Streptomyces sp. NPDC057428]|uniref:hypothetical protein n=1 Tax=Streptomyces sp. NPDC057428 TaxID=3346129 RepID=UPI0036B6E8FA